MMWNTGTVTVDTVKIDVPGAVSQVNGRTLQFGNWIVAEAGHECASNECVIARHALGNRDWSAARAATVDPAIRVL